MNTGSCELTIFEGPDGSGKTTAARAYAERHNTRYVHFGPLPRVTTGLFRMYVEAMLPAVLGYQPVVFDRSWLSEKPYGDAFRKGDDRLGDVQQAMLERLALRCRAVVFRCDPGWESVVENYSRRRHMEMLENTHQLYQVHLAYQQLRTALPCLTYDYVASNATCLPLDFTKISRVPAHPTEVATAGNWDAPTLLVGEAFAERKNQDPWYQWPFASTQPGCSVWLTAQLFKAGISEYDLVWANADQLEALPSDLFNRRVVALGKVAAAELNALGITTHEVVDHPQSWLRFNSTKRYPLLDMLKECENA